MARNGRTTVYNSITSPDKLAMVNKENIDLMEDFLSYLISVDRSKTTVEAYRSDLNIFWCWNLENNNNKFFVDVKKRDISKWQSHAIEVWKWSPKRVRRVKSALSSLSNFIENMLDDEFEGFRPIIRKIESPVDVAVRDKTVFTKEQLQELLDTLVENKQYDKACMLSLAMNCGKRKRELPRIKVNYFDEENIIYGSLYKSPEMITTKGRGSRGKQLTVYTLKNGFQPYLDLWMQYRKENGIESEWLIPKRENGVWTDEQIPITTMDSWAESFSRILGMPFYWHSIRHFFTTECSRSGLPDDVIKDLSGWASNDMVSIYKDFSVDEQFGKYFGEEGIKKVEQKSLSDM